MELQEKGACLEDILRSLRRVENKLEELKVNTGGEKWFKPRDDKNQVECLVRCSVISAGRINTVRQEFWADVYLSLAWKESRFPPKSERGENYEKDIDWNDYWDPQVYFVNAEIVHKEERWHTIEDFKGSTYVRLAIRMRATFTQVMDLRWFPVDYQKLTMKLMSDWPIDVVTFEKDCRFEDINHVRTDNFTDRHEWTLNKHLEAETVTEERNQTGSRNEYPHYHISMCVWRHYTFYLWNVSVVIFLILGLSFSSFAIPADRGGERLGVSLALLLTSVAYKYVVTSKLPMISYLTLVEKYVLGCLFIHALLIVQNAVCLLLAVKDNDVAIIMDTVSFYVLGFLVLALNAIITVVGFRKRCNAHSRMKNFGKKTKQHKGSATKKDSQQDLKNVRGTGTSV